METAESKFGMSESHLKEMMEAAKAAQLLEGLGVGNITPTRLLLDIRMILRMGQDAAVMGMTLERYQEKLKSLMGRNKRYYLEKSEDCGITYTFVAQSDDLKRLQRRGRGLTKMGIYRWVIKDRLSGNLTAITTGSFHLLEG